MTLQDFADALGKDPDLVARLRKQADLAEFKERYHVNKVCTLKCPTCGQAGYSGGSLWKDPDDPTRFVCRKCKIIYHITTEPISIEEILAGIKKANKDGTSIFEITGDKNGSNKVQDEPEGDPSEE